MGIDYSNPFSKRRITVQFTSILEIDDSLDLQRGSCFAILL